MTDFTLLVSLRGVEGITTLTKPLPLPRISPLEVIANSTFYPPSPKLFHFPSLSGIHLGGNRANRELKFRKKKKKEKKGIYTVYTAVDSRVKMAAIESSINFSRAIFAIGSGV